jgi:hypothetical protein
MICRDVGYSGLPLFEQYGTESEESVTQRFAAVDPICLNAKPGTWQICHQLFMDSKKIHLCDLLESIYSEVLRDTRKMQNIKNAVSC